MEHTPKSNFLGILVALLMFFLGPLARAQGPGLWMEYREVADPALMEDYRQQLQAVHLEGDSPTMRIIKEKLEQGLDALSDQGPSFVPPGEGARVLYVSEYDL